MFQASEGASHNLVPQQITRAGDMMPAEAAAATGPRTDKLLDSTEGMLLHSRLLGFYQHEIDRHHDNRRDQALDHDFYDGDQWSAEDLAVLSDRGQKPVTYNVIATSIDWVLGTEKRGRTDYKVLARRKDGSEQAQNKSKLLKYLDDVNRTGFSVSRAFADAIKGGVGWLEDGVKDDDDGEPIFSRYESWRNMLWDSVSTEMDLRDARYVFRMKWLDVDMAKSMFPKRPGQIEGAMNMASPIGSWDLSFGDEFMDAQEDASMTSGMWPVEGQWNRERVRVIECWFKKPVAKIPRIKGGQFDGEIYDEFSRGHRAEIESGAARIVERPGERIYLAIFTTAGLLFLGESPYRHNRYPFTPIWCFRRDRDNMPYGIIRRLRSIQEDINHRHSKALHILSTNKIVADSDAFGEGTTPEQVLEEASRPDAVMLVKRGSRFDFNVDRELAPAHISLMERSIMMIEQAGGVTNENLGRSTNAKSGIAIERRQEQGALSTATPFDNLRLAKQVRGEIQLSLVEQFMDEAKQIRIASDRGAPQYIDLNQIDPETGEIIPASDITRTKSDYVISEEEWRASVRQAQAEVLIGLISELAKTAPQIAVVMLDLAVESMDIPGRDEIVKRIRQMTGMSDPDAEQPTPEQMVRALMEQEAQKRAIRMEEATIAEKEASAAQKAAAAEKTKQDALAALAKVAGTNVETMSKALEAAMATISAPQIVPVADTIAREAGLVSRSEQEDEAAVAQQAADLEQMALEGAQMQQQADQAAMQEDPAAAGAAPPAPQPPAPA